MADQSKRFYILNCDNTYDLKIVEAFLHKVEEKHDFEIEVKPLYFGLHRMAEVCETTIPTLQMDFAIFVVNANESRLSINEENAGIGYAKLYRTLLQKTGNKVLIVIGGDSYYKDQDEEARFIISRWARRKVASQFREEFMDGRESFIFSWDQKHRPIHEEALLHYLDPSKKGHKFEYTPPRPLPKPKEPEVIPSAKDQGYKPFVVKDKKATGSLVTDRRPFTSDGDAQKRELSSDLEEASYGAIHPDVTVTPYAYPANTVLLETRMRNGRISYNAKDVMKWKDRWRPSEKMESDLMEEWKSTPVAKVKFIGTSNGGARYVVVKATPNSWKSLCDDFWRRRGRCFVCMVGACFLGLYLCWYWDLGSVVRALTGVGAAGAAINDTDL